jgi:hypothetical protein
LLHQPRVLQIRPRALYVMEIAFVIQEMRARNRVRENGAQLTQVFGIRDPLLIDLLDHGGEDAGGEEFFC